MRTLLLIVLFSSFCWAASPYQMCNYYQDDFNRIALKMNEKNSMGYDVRSEIYQIKECYFNISSYCDEVTKKYYKKLLKDAKIFK